VGDLVSREDGKKVSTNCSFGIVFAEVILHMIGGGAPAAIFGVFALCRGSAGNVFSYGLGTSRRVGVQCQLQLGGAPV